MLIASVIAATDPNRVYWQTGSINIPGGNVRSKMGPALDNNDAPVSSDDLAVDSCLIVGAVQGCVDYPGGAKWSCCD